MGIEVADVLVEQCEVVRRNFGGGPNAHLLRLAHGLHGFGGGDVCDVDVRLRLLRQLNVTSDNVRLGSIGHSPQAETERCGPKVHRASGGAVRVFSVLHHRQLEARSEAQGVTHDSVVEDGTAVVADSDCSGFL